MATLVSQAIAQCQNRLRSTYKRRVTTLIGTTTINATTLAVTSYEGIGRGSLICVGTEVFYVVDTPLTTTVNVIPHFAGTTTAIHTAGDVVEVNYAHAMGGLLNQHLYNEIASWATDLYQIGTVQLSGAVGVRGYNTSLTYGTEAYHALRVWLGPESSAIDNDWSPVGFRTMRRGPVALGNGEMVISVKYDLGTSRDIYLEYAKPFDLDPFELTTDLIATVGLAQSMVEVAVLGACYKALSEITTADTQAQVESRNEAEVPPGQITSIREDLRREYIDRRRQEQQRLQGQYPPRES